MSNSPFDDVRTIDALRKALEEERAAHLRAQEQREEEIEQASEKKRAGKRNARSEASKQLGESGKVESDRIIGMRRHRSDLDSEATVSQDVALRLVSDLGQQYSPGRTNAGDLFRAPVLPRFRAARAAGLEAAPVKKDPLLHFLKYAGMAGCQLLGTFGMGSLCLQVAPKALLSSPLIVIAAGLGAILVSGSYLAVVPASKRYGIYSAAAPESAITRSARATACCVVAATGSTIAFVDAKALAAIQGARAIIDPSSAPSFGTTLLVAAALSATYVIGAAMMAFAEGYDEEAEAMVAGTCAEHAEAWCEKRRENPEVRQAVEALNYADAVDSRRRELGKEIDSAEGQLRQAFRHAFEQVAPGAETDEGASRASAQEHGLRAKVAGIKLAAYNRHRPSRANAVSTEDGRGLP